MPEQQFWQITPVADPGDPRWQGSRRYQKVMVAAESPAMARMIASKQLNPPAKCGVGNESRNNHSKFNDEKLYRVDPVDIAEAERIFAKREISAVVLCED